MTYTVHMFPIVRVTVANVEAESQQDAMRKAEEMTDLHRMFSTVNTEYAEDMDGFHVDEAGDSKYERSKWYDKEYRPM